MIWFIFFLAASCLVFVFLNELCPFQLAGCAAWIPAKMLPPWRGFLSVLLWQPWSSVFHHPDLILWVRHAGGSSLCLLVYGLFNPGLNTCELPEPETLLVLFISVPPWGWRVSCIYRALRSAGYFALQDDGLLIWACHSLPLYVPRSLQFPWRRALSVCPGSLTLSVAPPFWFHLLHFLSPVLLTWVQQPLLCKDDV